MTNNSRANLRRGGKPGNKGGGRPKDEFLAWCRKLASSPKARKFITALIQGDPIQEKIIDTPGHEAQMILVSASPEARFKAWAYVSDRAHGKAPQALEMSGAGGGPLIVKVINYADAPVSASSQSEGNFCAERGRS